MFHMHTTFFLSADTSVDEFRASLGVFSALMQNLGLLEHTGPVAERCKHPIMDTDEGRDHRYFFSMTFRDRKQCDAAVKHIKTMQEESHAIHKAVYANVVDPVFSCWMD
jgi:hypothetical protein